MKTQNGPALEINMGRLYPRLKRGGFTLATHKNGCYGQSAKKTDSRKIKTLICQDHILRYRLDSLKALLVKRRQ